MTQRRPGQQDLFCAYADTRGRRHCVRGGTGDKAKALMICRAREKAARKTAAGTFDPEEARKLITAAMEDMLLPAGATVQKATLRDWFSRWLESKALDTESGTHTRYKAAVNDFLGFMGESADRDIFTLTPAKLEAYRADIGKWLAPSTANISLWVIRPPVL